jgi:hypothetical protein
MNSSEIRIYKSLAKLSVKQLASIASQLESDSGRLARMLFVYRNTKIKHLLQKLWLQKNGSSNENAGQEVMDDMDFIQGDTTKWPHFTETEVEYLQMIFNGIHQVFDDDEETEQQAASQGSSSVNVALPVVDRS